MNGATLLSSATYFNNLKDRFIMNFIDDKNYMYLLNGLKTTVKITFFAVILGIILGFIVGVISSTYDKTADDRGKSKLYKGALSILNAVCRAYLSIIRGTPVLVQLMIIYFGIFQSSDVNKVFVAIIAFGINSGAYVAEIFRSGIMSIDNGQFEAGRCLGFNYLQTMVHIIMPQATKNVLPALVNEFIALLKETSIAGFIALEDLTKGGDIIRSRTFDFFLPYIAVAAIYWIIVTFMTALVGKLERRLRNSDH